MNIIYIGPFSGCGGLSQDNRKYAIALHDLGHYVRIVDIDDSSTKAILNMTETSKLSKMKENKIDKDFYAIHSYNPNNFHQLIQKQAKMNIFITSTYTDAYPSYWAQAVNMADQIWTYNNTNKTAIEGYGIDHNKVKIIPFSVDSTIYNASGHQAHIENLEDDHFVALSVMPWERKKGWDLLIPSFIMRFRENNRATLLLKTWKNHDLQLGAMEIEDQIRSIRNQFKSKFGEDPKCHIKIINYHLGTDQMAALYRRADCYVAPIRGGDHFNSILEAMASSLPIVITNVSDKLDFLSKDNSVRFDILGTSPVSADMEENRLRPWFAGHRWLEPNPDALSKAINFIHSNPEEAEKIGNAGSACIYNMTTKHSAELMIKYLNGEDVLVSNSTGKKTDSVTI